MGKEAITITIDRHIHQWIKDQGGNKSRVVNRILTNAWITRDNIDKRMGQYPVRKKTETTFSLRPPTPSSNGVYYLVQIRESRVRHYLDRGFTLHDRTYTLNEQKTLIWNLHNMEVNCLGAPIASLGWEEE